ncbi:ADP-ribosylhydrolase ARH1-like [Mya arenaria]|uniref:ADP-ribosylhydrolase ARH1-like n=1 Tax=Mya arenaria TaxID=6604 RepID=UPI0022E8C8F8|nr:ADP-ribosylhydrolase ARH1-like [Mya arenaria]
MAALSGTLDKYQAAMVLSAVGDSLGYKNGDWEFCKSGSRIHKEVRRIGGIESIHVTLPYWPASDDTVLHIATAKALVAQKRDTNKEVLYSKLAEQYKVSMQDMGERAVGPTTESACHLLDPWRPGGYKLPFNHKGGGAGAAMRSMCIGLRYPKPEQLDDLIEVSIESGRMTHHHPTGYLGSLASALFTSYAIQRKHIHAWGYGLMQTLPRAQEYIKSRNEYVRDNMREWNYFKTAWARYLNLRRIEDGISGARFPQEYGVETRDDFYHSLSFNGWAGSSGHDAPMIAYDAILRCGPDWRQLCNTAIFHGGDSDTTGAIAGCWYGALYGFDSVPSNNYKDVEFNRILMDLGKSLQTLSKL